MVAGHALWVLGAKYGPHWGVPTSFRKRVVKGLILSGGAGTRLRPITHTSAKQLVPVANKPILFYGIEDMVAAGITEIGIVTGETGPEVQKAVGDGAVFGANITYIPQEAPLGLAHCVLIAADFIGEDDFVMYLGDNMLQQGLTEFVERFESGRGKSQGVSTGVASAQILLCPVADPERFGVAETDENGNVIRLVEKPEQPKSNLALVGVYLFTPMIFEAVSQIHPSDRGELEITDAIQWLIDRDYVVQHELLAGWWLDTGKKDPLLEANRRVLDMLDGRIDGTIEEGSEIDGRVIVEVGAQIINSHIRGPAIIGKNTIVKDSHIGAFTSIANDCEIFDSDIDNSVILERVQIKGVPRLVDSLVGRGSHVFRSTSRPSATRLMIGDDCTVDLD